MRDWSSDVCSSDLALEQRGLISSDMLTQKQIDLYFRHAAELGITMETTVKEI